MMPIRRYALLAVFSIALSGLASSAYAAEAMGLHAVSAQSVRQRVLQEIVELEQKQKLQADLFEQHSNQIIEAQKALEEAEAGYRGVCDVKGKDSPEALRTSQTVEAARQALYGQISEREHVRFRINTLQQVIQQRRLSLSYQEGTNDQSVWK